MLEVCGKYPRIIVVEINLQFDILKWQNGSWISAVEAPKKRRQKRRLVQAPKRRLYIVNAVLKALLLWSFWDATDLCATFGSKVMSILK